MKDVRPTSGKVLLALFSILGGLEDVPFLDLFSGTGRVGIEALRRGASPVVLVETLKDRARGIERALAGEHAKNAEKSVVLALELRRAAAWLIRRKMRFGVVFADPPYNEGWGKSLLHVDALGRLLSPQGLLAVEHAAREPLDVPPSWRVTDARVYGETGLTLLKAAETGPETGKILERQEESLWKI